MGDQGHDVVAALDKQRQAVMADLAVAEEEDPGEAIQRAGLFGGLDDLPHEIALAHPDDLVGPADVFADEPDARPWSR